MGFISDTQSDATLRRVQLEARRNDSDVERLQRQVRELEQRLDNQVEPPVPPPPTRQGINNMIRNSDLAHSVDTWFNPESYGEDADEPKECANVYAYPKLDPITITDAAITNGDATLTSASNPFTSGMVGRYVQVDGAGAGGSDLITTIASYTNAGEVELAVNAGTTVSGATARINLQYLTHRNKRNTAGANPNDALRTTDHSVNGNPIDDPIWNKSRGICEIGSTNIVAFTLGYFSDTGLTSYVPLHMLFPGREPFLRFNIARKSQYVYSPGRLFAGIYNNKVDELDWVRGNDFVVNGVVDNPPVLANQVSTDYMVMIETDLGYTIVGLMAAPLTNAPTDTGFSAGSRVRIGWQYFAGTVRAKVYRKRTGEANVYLMDTIASGANQWADTNPTSRQQTAYTSFASLIAATPNVVRRLPSYWSSPLENLTEITVDGTPGEFWEPVQIRLPFPPTVNLGQVADPHLIIGLTEPLSTRITDGVGSGSNIDSAAAQFTAAMAGKTAVVTNPATGSVLTTTVSAYVDADTITLTNAPPAASNLIVEIKDSQPKGLYFDLVGLSFNEGEWDFHPDDARRPQAVAANPNGSTQGGTGGQSPTSTGGTGGTGHPPPPTEPQFPEQPLPGEPQA